MHGLSVCQHYPLFKVSPHLHGKVDIMVARLLDPRDGAQISLDEIVLAVNLAVQTSHIHKPMGTDCDTKFLHMRKNGLTHVC